MATYILSMENYGYALLNDIRQFNQVIGQPTTQETVLAIYKELLYQVVSSWSIDRSVFAQQLMNVPVWPTILYIEDSDRLFDAKRQFAAQVHHFAIALYEHFRTMVKVDERYHHTVLLESVTATVLIVNVYDDASPFEMSLSSNSL